MDGSCTVYSPIGALTIIYRKDPLHLTRICLPGRDVSSTSQEVQNGTIIRGNIPGMIAKVAALIEDYFNGGRISTPWEILQTGGLTTFQLAVLRETARIPYGVLKTYKSLAEALGRPRAGRAVGTALAKNPYPILIPCHRVIRSDHTLGGFGGGTAIKKWLIEHEAHSPLVDQDLL